MYPNTGHVPHPGDGGVDGEGVNRLSEFFILPNELRHLKDELFEGDSSSDQSISNCFLVRSRCKHSSDVDVGDVVFCLGAVGEDAFVGTTPLVVSVEDFFSTVKVRETRVPGVDGLSQLKVGVDMVIAVLM